MMLLICLLLRQLIGRVPCLGIVLLVSTECTSSLTIILVGQRELGV